MSANLEDIVSLAKRRGFVYQGSEIYGGLAGTWDYGPLGSVLKRNIVNAWLKHFVDASDDMYMIDSAILMNPAVWKASGHVDTFTDPLVECSNCHSRFRADQVDIGKCPNCGKENTFGEARQFNMMFETKVGPMAHLESFTVTRRKAEEMIKIMDQKGEDSFTEILDAETNRKFGDYATYLRPETAQGMFTNYKNVLDSFYPDMPFGLAQVGKSFRNEISPREFLFRVREFEIAEFEYFVHPDKWEESFEKWHKDMYSWFEKLGLPKDKIHEIEVPEEDRAHYSKRTIDFEFDYPFGRREIAGLAYRTDFDLKNHQEHSGKNMEYRPKDGSDPYIPHVIEPTFGIERHFLAVLANAYCEDEVEGEKRIFLKLPAELAPVKVAVFPLLKNKPELIEKAKEVYKSLKKELGAGVMWDDNGNIGKRYRRQDEIGTPYCITVDFQTLEDNTVTLRNRDTTEQQRIKVEGSMQMLKAI